MKNICLRSKQLLWIILYIMYWFLAYIIFLIYYIKCGLKSETCLADRIISNKSTNFLTKYSSEMTVRFLMILNKNLLSNSADKEWNYKL